MLTVESADYSAVGGVTGECYFPRRRFGKEETLASRDVERIQEFNNLLTWDGIDYAAATLKAAISRVDEEQDDFFASSVLSSLAASLCLLPRSVPTISSRAAFVLMPHVKQCILGLEQLRSKSSKHSGLFSNGLKEGKWAIRATGSSGASKDVEEYIVDFTSTTDRDGVILGFEGRGVGTTGKSKNGLVAIFGATQGSSITFVEEWSDGSEEGFGSTPKDDSSSCVVSARLSLCGERFEGAYRNVQYGTIGQIVGVRRHEVHQQKAVKILRSKELAPTNVRVDYSSTLASCEALLCLALGHLATILAEDRTGDLDEGESLQENDSDASESVERRQALKDAILTPLLSAFSLPSEREAIAAEFDSIRCMFASPCHTEIVHGLGMHSLLEKAWSSLVSERTENVTSSDFTESLNHVALLDQSIASQSGGFGSLRALCPSEYGDARQRVVCLVIHICGLSSRLRGAAMAKQEVDDQLRSAWQSSLQLVEENLRNSLRNSTSGSKRDLCLSRCLLISRTCEFLLSLDRSRIELLGLSIPAAVSHLSWCFALIKRKSDLNVLQEEMQLSSKRGLLRLVALEGVVSLVSNEELSCPGAVDSLCVGLPRLIGLAHAEDMSLTLARSNEYGSNENYGLGGARSSLRDCLLRSVNSLYENLSRILAKHSSQNDEQKARLLVDSLSLSILAVFAGSMKGADVDARADILPIISKLLNFHRRSLLGDLDGFGFDTDKDHRLVKVIHTLCQRDLSRAVLRSSVSTAHVLTFHATNESRVVAEQSPSINACLELLRNELVVTCPLIEGNVVKKLECDGAARIDEEVRRWRKSLFHVERSTETKESAAYQVGDAGIEFLRENGTMMNAISQPTAPKQTIRQKSSLSSSSATTARQSGVIKARVLFSHSYLSHWLHILSAAVRAPVSLSHIARDSGWLEVLLKITGLCLEPATDLLATKLTLRSQSAGILPAKFRSRVLYHLTPLFSAVKASPMIVEGLLMLAGNSSNILSRSLDPDERFVSREAVSLLRHLHSTDFPQWRQCINDTTGQCISADMSSMDNFRKKVGVLCFLSGSIESISRGSHVLLKPSAAIPLAQEHQSAPSGKSHSSSIGGGTAGPPPVGATPHHIVGNGTESIVAGLCRFEALAGTVSNIDIKNGLCEVILLARESSDEADLSSEGVSHEGALLSGRQTLTVRALRTQLSDLVHAQEVPLHLDTFIPAKTVLGSVLDSSLDSLLSAAAPGQCSESTPPAKPRTDQEKAGVPDTRKLRSGVLSLSSDLLVLRSSIVLLSDERLLSSLLESEAGKNTMWKLLHLAWPQREDVGGMADLVNDAKRECLSSLPSHEARYVHLQSLLREIGFRMQLVDNMSEADWENKVSFYKVQEQSDGENVWDALNSAAPSTKVAPPRASTRSSVSSSSGLNAATGRSEFGRDMDSHSNRSISQSTGGSNSEEEEDEESESAVTAAAHLREAAIAQMAELGLPRSWSELALRRTGGTNIEAAVTFCLERGGEMERLLADERERERMMQRETTGSAPRRRSTRDIATNHLLRQLQEMGFPSRWCAEALAVTGNNVDDALTWILTNGERLREEDEAMEAEGDAADVEGEEEDESADEDEDEDEDEGASVSGERKEASTLAPNEDSQVSDKDLDEVVHMGWAGSIIPLRFISGRATINPKTMEISGLPTGGFSSVGTKGVLLTSGKWYYEAVLETAGCLQIGWADGSFAGHCNSDRG